VRRVLEDARSTGCVTTLRGRRRLLPLIARGKPGERAAAERQVGFCRTFANGVFPGAGQADSAGAQHRPAFVSMFLCPTGVLSRCPILHAK
jgi:hypothetical protein